MTLVKLHKFCGGLIILSCYHELQNSEIEDCCESWANLSENGFHWTKGEELPDTQNSSDIQTHYYCRLIAIKFFLLS